MRKPATMMIAAIMLAACATEATPGAGQPDPASRPAPVQSSASTRFEDRPWYEQAGIILILVPLAALIGWAEMGAPR